MGHALVSVRLDAGFAKEADAVWARLVSSLLAQDSSKRLVSVAGGRLYRVTADVVVDISAPAGLENVSAVGVWLNKDKTTFKRLFANACGLYSSEGRKVADWVLLRDMPADAEWIFSSGEKCIANEMSLYVDQMRVMPSSSLVIGPFSTYTSGRKREVAGLLALLREGFPCNAWLAVDCLLLTTPLFVAVVPTNSESVGDTVFWQQTGASLGDGLFFPVYAISLSAARALIELMRQGVSVSVFAIPRDAIHNSSSLIIRRNKDCLLFSPSYSGGDPPNGPRAYLSRLRRHFSYISTVVARQAGLPLSKDAAMQMRLLRRESWQSIASTTEASWIKMALVRTPSCSLSPIIPARDKLEDDTPVLYSTGQSWSIAPFAKAGNPGKDTDVLSASLVAKALGHEYSSWTVHQVSPGASVIFQSGEKHGSTTLLSFFPVTKKAR